MIIGNYGQEGFSKAKAFRGKYKATLELPECWEDQIKFPLAVE